jgi:hypothetical protein
MARDFIDGVFDDLLYRAPFGVMWERTDAAVLIRPADRPQFSLLVKRDTADGERRFVVELRERLGSVFARPAMPCPLHDRHELEVVGGDGAFQWSCPEGAWACPVGGLRDAMWPPGVDVPPGRVAQLLSARFRDRGIRGLRQLGCELRDRAWVAVIQLVGEGGPTPSEIFEAAAPFKVEVRWVRDDPKAWQKRNDRRLEAEREWAKWALEQWSGFPVDAHPRPLVFVGPTARPEGGFHSGAAKLAFHRGDIAAMIPIPDDVLRSLKPRGPLQAPLRPNDVPLRVTDAVKLHAEFLTDRGRRSLPAWRLRAEDAIGPIWALAPEVERWSRPDPPTRVAPLSGSPHRAGEGWIEADGVTLHFHFSGDPSSVTEYPSAEVIETSEAVTVLPVARDIGPPGWRALPGQGREVVAKLARPLVGRVLVDLDASPVVVHDAPEPGPKKVRRTRR